MTDGQGDIITQVLSGGWIAMKGKKNGYPFSWLYLVNNPLSVGRSFFLYVFWTHLNKELLNYYSINAINWLGVHGLHILTLDCSQSATRIFE